MKIVWIHGLHATSRSFDFICKELNECDSVFINYNSHQRLAVSIEQVREQLPQEPSCLIGYSLGGVIAALLAADHPERIKQLVTISAPLNGSKAAVMLHWLPWNPPVMNDIIPSSPIITRCMELRLLIPTLSIISTGGHLSTSPEPNDSVVAVASQKALKFGQKVEIKASHFEILLSPETVIHLRKFLFSSDK